MEANINHSPDVHSKLSEPFWFGRDVLRIVIAIGILFVFGLCIFFVINKVFFIDYAKPGKPSIVISLSLGFLECASLLAGVYLFGLRGRKQNWKGLVVEQLSRSWFWISIIVGLVVIPVTGWIATAIQRLLGQPMSNPQINFLAPEGFSWTGFLGMLLIGGFLAPLAEEVFFRGVLFRWLRPLWGFFPAAVVSSLFFGILHGDPAIGVAAFVLGIVFAVLFEKSRSLWSAIIVHVLNNSIKIILLYSLLAAGIKI